MARRFSYQEKHLSIYDSDSNEDSDNDNNTPIGRKINKKGNYMLKIDEIKYQKNEIFKDDKSNTETLQKNRQSARECRERKKIYIDLLEKKVEELKHQIDTSKNNLRSQLKILNKLTSQIDPNKMQYLTQKIQIQKVMSNTNPITEPKQLTNLIDLYLYKFDVNGKLRKQLVNCQFQNLLKLMLDHKFFNFWDGSLGVTEMFQNNCFDIFSMDVNNLGVNPLSSNIHNNRSTMLHLLMQIRDVKRNLQAQGQRIQYLIQKLAKHLTPQGILKFVLHPLYVSESNKLDLGISLTDSFTSVSTKKAKLQ